MLKGSSLSLAKLTVQEGASLKDAIRQIDQNLRGFVCVINTQGKLLGTITDGDVRRSILESLDLERPCEEIMNLTPTVASVELDEAAQLELLQKKGVRCLPLLDEDGKLVDVTHLSNLLMGPVNEKIAVIMAGGEGRRLRPFTENIPKPMLEVEGRPILEHIIEKLKTHGFKKFYLSVNYLSEVIEDHFKDGSDFGIEVNYLREKEKLGTAGALSLLPSGVSNAILVLNGDVISDVNFQNFLDFHIDNKSDFTMAASTYKIEIPFGVLKLDGEAIVGIDEKPTKSYLCNAGIYMLSPQVLTKVPRDTRFDMTELLNKSIESKYKINVFPLHECWLDVGRKEDLIRAKEIKK